MERLSIVSVCFLAIATGQELPGAGFPAADAAASNAAWPTTGKQPAWDAAWAKDANGAPAPCWQRSVLSNTEAGWPGKCLGLDKFEDATYSVVDQPICQRVCEENMNCSVWQFTKDTGCWQGRGEECYNRDGTSRGFVVLGAQRLQHGSVRVLKNMNATWVLGLRDLGQFSSGTSDVNAARCKKWCYSNIKCTYWQYGSNGCWAEDPDFGTSVQFPLTTTGGCEPAYRDGSSNPARTMLAGEYIQHYCPPAPTPAPVDKGRNMTPIYVGVAALCVLGIVGAFLCFCRSSPGKKRAVKKTRAVKVKQVEEQPAEPESVPLVPLMMQQPAPYAPAMMPVQMMQAGPQFGYQPMTYNQAQPYPMY